MVPILILDPDIPLRTTFPNVEWAKVPPPVSVPAMASQSMEKLPSQLGNVEALISFRGE